MHLDKIQEVGIANYLVELEIPFVGLLWDRAARYRHVSWWNKASSTGDDALTEKKPFKKLPVMGINGQVRLSGVRRFTSRKSFYSGLHHQDHTYPYRCSLVGNEIHVKNIQRIINGEYLSPTTRAELKYQAENQCASSLSHCRISWSGENALSIL